MKISLQPERLLQYLLLLIFGLFVLNGLGIFARFWLGHDYVYGLMPLFDFDTERNVPTFYSAVAILLASAQLLIISCGNRARAEPILPWLGLSIIFMLLSIDEFSSLHEKLIPVFRGAVSTSGYLYFAWVIPYGVGLGVLVLLYFRFLLGLPRRTLTLFIASGVLFVAGAIGMELVAGQHAVTHGTGNFGYSLIYTVEETLEMLGIALFNYALLSHAVQAFGSVSLVSGKPDFEPVGANR